MPQIKTFASPIAIKYKEPKFDISCAVKVLCSIRVIVEKHTETVSNKQAQISGTSHSESYTAEQTIKHKETRRRRRITTNKPLSSGNELFEMVSTATISATTNATTIATDVTHYLVNATSDICAARYQDKIPSIPGKCNSDLLAYLFALCPKCPFLSARFYSKNAAHLIESAFCPTEMLLKYRYLISLTHYLLLSFYRLYFYCIYLWNWTQMMCVQKWNTRCILPSNHRID